MILTLSHYIIRSIIQMSDLTSDIIVDYVSKERSRWIMQIAAPYFTWHSFITNKFVSHVNF